MAGRPEVPLDPAAGPAQRFAFELRKLRAEAGGITYRSLAQRAGYGVTTLSQAASGEQLPTLAVVLAYVKACGGDPSEWEARWKQAVDEAAASSSEDEESGAPPYRGLARFEPGDTGRFFGRDKLTADALELVRRRRFAAVFGASGSGKSSLLRAGLIPALRDTQDIALRPAAIRILTPGQLPARTHTQVFDTSPATDDVQADVFVIVDQFEEVFTLCHDPAERAAFIDLLLTARQPSSRLRILLAVRADFYGRCAEHPGLADALRDANLLVGPMTPAELREAIVKPAAAEGLTVERALTARIVDEVADAPGGLPLFSHVLLETWRRRRGKTMTLTGYEAAGGLEGAVAKTAEDVYRRFSDAQAATARRLLLRLVAPGEGTPDTGRPTEREELASFGRQETAEALEALAQARLLILNGGTVDLAHESLLTAWPRLRGWIDEDRERLRTHRKLTEAARTWEELGREPGALYRGSRLATAQEHLSDAPQDLTDLEHAFLTASLADREQALSAAARVTRRLRALTGTLSVLLVLSVLVSMVAYRQRQAADAAGQVALSRQLAAQSATLIRTNPELAVLLAVHAYRTSPTSQALESLYTASALPLRKTFRHHYRTPVVAEEFSPDGRTLAVSDSDGGVFLWDTGSGRLRDKWRAAHDESVTAMAFSRDGRTLGTTDGVGGAVRLWDADSGRLRKPLRPQAQAAGADADWSVFSLAFSPDGRTLATGNNDGTVRMWDTETGRLRRSLLRRTGPGVSVAFSPDGRTLAATSFYGAVRLWDTDTGRLRRSLPGTTGPVDAMAFSPDGRTLALATAGRSRTVRLWDTDTGRLRRSLPGPVASLAFSPDGGTLATTSEDRVVRLWDTDTGRLRHNLPGRTGAVTSLAFSPNGRTLAVSSDDDTVRIWDVSVNPRAIHTRRLKDAESMALSQDGRTLATSKGIVVRVWETHSGRLQASLPKSRAQATSLALSPDGRTLAVNDAIRGIELWNTSTGRLRRSVPTYSSDASSMAFNQQGNTLATTSPDRGTELWDVATGRRRERLRVEKGTSGHLPLAFSPDGRTLALEGAEGQVRLYDTRTGLLRKSLTDQSAPLVSLAFSSDGRTVAAGSGNSTVAMWDSDARRRFLRSLSEATGSLAFSPDGRTLATASTDNRIQLLDVATGGNLAALSGHTNTVKAIAWSRDGRTLTTASADQTVRVWNAALPTPAAAIRKICRAVGRDLTMLEQNRYLPDLEAEQNPETGCHPTTGD